MNAYNDTSLSIAQPHDLRLSAKVGLGLVGIGLLLITAAWFGAKLPAANILLAVALLLLTAGTIIHARGLYLHLPEGIKNNGVWLRAISNKGAIAWLIGIILTGFYVLLYWFPQYLGLGTKDAASTGLVAFFDPLSKLLNGNPASQWFVYGTLYTVAILAMGYKFILKYRHSRYQVVRTISVMFFQTGFAFLIPELLERLNSGKPYFDKDLKNMWPLNYDFFYDWHLGNLLKGGGFGMFMLIFGVAMIFLISPILTYFYGKRWYCSWVCGCGGLAETAGDPFRQLSDKSLNAWKIERWLIHSVLVFVTLMTVAVIYSYLGKNDGSFWLNKDNFAWGTAGFFLAFGALVYVFRKRFEGLKEHTAWLIGGVAIVIGGVLLINHFSGANHVFFIHTNDLRSVYGFLIGAAFSGVIGVGFYPLMGSRVWCRFGCPMAAILGLQQKFFSRFRITTNGGQCISCGNCSTYCEMGIDVRAYAQRGQNVVRASCVGCGICAAVCPRGVLKLENGSTDISARTDETRTIRIGKEGVSLM